MPKLPRIPSLLVLRALKRGRFYEYHQSGSHVQLRHPEKSHLRVTIPFHRKDLNPKTLWTSHPETALQVLPYLAILGSFHKKFVRRSYG